MENYKGMHYSNHVEQHYYEGGAHFKYKDLYCKLENLAKYLPKRRGEAYFYLEDKEKQRSSVYSRNTQSIIKSQSQKQLDNIYPHYTQKHNLNHREDSIKYKDYHPRTKSEEQNKLKPIKIPHALNSNKEKPFSTNRIAYNNRKSNQTRNIINSINELSSIKHTGYIPYNNSSNSYSKTYLSKKLSNDHKPACTLIKAPRDILSLNYCYDKNAFSNIDDDKSQYSFIRGTRDNNNSLHMKHSTFNESNVLNAQPSQNKQYDIGHFSTTFKQNDSLLYKTNNRDDLLLTHRNNNNNNNNDDPINLKKHLIIEDISSGYNFNYSKRVNSNQRKTIVNPISDHHTRPNIVSYKEYKANKNKLNNNLSIKYDNTNHCYSKGHKRDLGLRSKPSHLKENIITVTHYISFPKKPFIKI